MAQPENIINIHHHSMSDLIRKTVDRIDDHYHRGGNFTAISSGFTGFDELTNGLQPPELIVVAGRPSMGTSTFATNIVEHVAIDSGIDVAVFIYRDELYCESTPDEGIAEVIIDKHRYGPEGVVKLKFMGEYCKFEDNVYSFNDGKSIVFYRLITTRK